MTRFEDVLAALDKDSKDLLKLGSEIVVEKLPNPSLGLELALEGGFRCGSQVLIWGPKSAGKTTYCLQQIAAAQREGKVCAFFDVEGTYDPKWGARLGVDNDKLMLYTTRTTATFTDRAVAMIKAGVDLVVLDSVTALMPSSYVEKDGEIKDFDNTRQIGSLARDISDSMRLINGANEANGTTFIIISQARMGQKGPMFWGMKSTGGEGLRFYSTTVLKLNSSNSQGNMIKGETKSGNMLIEKPVGRVVTWEIELNKSGSQGFTGQYELMFDQEPVGINRNGEVLDYGVRCGIIEKAGSWYSYQGQKLGQGPQKAQQKLEENMSLVKEIESEILGGRGKDSVGRVSVEEEE